MQSRVSRRHFLGAVGAGAAVLASGSAACSDTSSRAAETTAGEPDDVIAFRGVHQAGVTTAAQDRLVFSALDVVSRDRNDLARLLAKWTVMAEAMTVGDPVPGNQGDLVAAPADTGEAYGLSASHLTITIGFGPTLFDDRFGLASKRPDLL